jgi:molybdopterin converting factor small subunit
VLVISRFVRNGEYLPGPVGRLSGGDELAIHPPYSGG